MTWIVSTVILLFLLAVMALAFIATEGLDRESRIISDEMESFRLYGESLQEKHRALRRYRHDADALVQAIEYALAQEEAPAGAGEACKSVPGTPAVLPATFGEGAGGVAAPYPGLALVDAIVGLKRRQCVDAGIGFTAGASPDAPAVLERLGIPEADVTAVVQNLLENAYEASLRLDASAGPFIAFTLECPTDGGIRIRVSNRVNSPEAPAFRTGKPNPERHGLGMRIVDDIARSYGGSVRTGFDPATRILQVRVSLG